MDNEIEETKSRLEEGTKSKCPKFDGNIQEYNEWKGKLEDWIFRNQNTDKYIGLTVRGALHGEPWELVAGLDREEVIKVDGWKRIIDILDKKYGVDKKWKKIEYINQFFKIERKRGENMKDFISKFELALRNCYSSGMKELDEEQLGGLFLGKAKLEENEEKIVLRVMDSDLSYTKIINIMSGIFKGEKNEEKKVWMTQKDREIRCYKCDKTGNISRNCKEERKIKECVGCGKKGHIQEECRHKERTCYGCGEKGHMKYDCKREKERKDNVVFYGDEEEYEKDWEIIRGIIDTGCNNSVVGDL